MRLVLILVALTLCAGCPEDNIELCDAADDRDSACETEVFTANYEDECGNVLACEADCTVGAICTDLQAVDADPNASNAYTECLDGCG
jgi:hypothetical protein